MRRRLIFAAAVLLAVPLFAAAPRFGREVAAAPYEYGDPGRAIHNAAIATDGDGYLAVWGDTRRGNSIQVARLAADGTLLDKAGIRLGDGYFAQVIWTGESYVVAWRYTEGVWMAKVSRDGVVSGARLVVEGPGGPDVALATTGRTIAVAMSGGPLVLLDLDLSVLARVAIGAAPSPQNTLGIAASRNQYLVAFAREAGVLYTQTATDTGARAPSEPLVAAGGASGVSVASDGTSYFVVWTTATSELQGQFVSTENVTVNAAATFASDGPVTGENARVVQSPSVIWSGGEYLVTYFVGGAFFLPQDVRALLVSRSGEPAGSTDRFGSTTGLDHANAAAKSDGSGAVVWTSSDHRVRVGFFDATSIATRDPFTKVVSAASAARFQYMPSIVAVERTPLVAWIEQASGIDEVRLGRPGAAPVVVSETRASRVWLTYDGATVAVVWQPAGNVQEVHVRRYTPGLEAIDAAPHRIVLTGRGAIESVAAANGIIALTSVYGGAIWFTRLEANDDGFMATSFRLTQNQPENTEDLSSRVVWDGNRFAVVWLRDTISMFFDNMGTSIFGALVRSDGALLASGVAYELFGGGIYSLHAAARDGRVVIAWQEALLEPGAGDPQGVATYVANFESGPLARRTLVTNEDILTERLAGLELHRDGRADVYWLSLFRNGTEASIRAMRLAPSLDREGDALRTERFPASGFSNWYEFTAPLDFDATIAGDDAVIAYVRRDDAPEAGSAARVVVREELGAVVKRRAVR